MAHVVVLGAGVSGHTAALYLKKRLGKRHEVVVVSPNSKWNWIPSNIWVGVGRMSPSRVVFPLAPIYRRKGIGFRQAKAVTLYPEGDAESPRGAVDVVYTDPARVGRTERIRYDYLVNATGPKLNFEATPGLGPDAGNTVSVCTPSHAVDAAARLAEVIATLRAGTPQTLVVGVGHGTCTCEGAAFEYAFNVEQELRNAGVRDLAQVIYLTNEHELGDVGVGGMTFSTGGRRVTSEAWMESLFRERTMKAITQAAVTGIEPGLIHYTQIDGSENTQSFDFAMLLPPFRGVELTAFDRDGVEITDKVFAPSGFMRVDANYEAKPYEQWTAQDWPRTYQTPSYRNVFGVGIAFAPPHAISRPYATPGDVAIAPSPPRTGMPSGAMGKIVALTIADMILTGATEPTHHGSMGEMAAACIASTGTGILSGTAAAMSMSPIVPDHARHPNTGGRDPKETTGDIGLAAHWVKRVLHTMFIYKAKAYPLWYLIPEITETRLQENPMDNAQHRIDTAPLPDARELRRRSNLFVQFVRFLRLNFTMFMPAKRHH
ncbi:NAD(P)/FAD-dependent oxidoreductase [Cryobacterium sp. TMT1-21]|uniref:NAD(P)/FAD-dependent oxidoreductase n=1 Tax=unclassified Cryobacterium TaxID=2649013 RepID=UPI00106BD9DD|nr:MULTISPECIES: FAD/NAD(P)-binding oxidoreductase [unclassified Cryobacterium]TFD11944.1 NAD(P)/FAD-dependent oxidoreductase [Cryobacterium sp. TMT1-21]TFD18940.1 NAD(P)/FAD-dependent oxidoreductase [Cryobacterium sp. TMT2-23]TFD20972.1 NAD(P)/FAD-dependent oxidoreductase [Cryobacterium sp. TMT4-10]TFD35752.1 NAD(P)/FAD-dependent oxidoreductase [Cryobacterium sp. TMT2-10]